MLFKKKKEVQAASRKETIEGFLKAYIDAEDTPDAGEKLLKLAKLSTDIQNEIFLTEMNARISGKKKGFPVYLGGAAGTFALAITLAPISPWLVLGVGIPGAFGSLKLAHKTGDILGKKLIKEAKDYIGCIHSQKKITDDAMKKILDGAVEPLVHSRKSEDVLKNFPELTPRFLAVARRKSPDTPPPAPPGFTL